MAHFRHPNPAATYFLCLISAVVLLKAILFIDLSLPLSWCACSQIITDAATETLTNVTSISLLHSFCKYPSEDRHCCYIGVNHPDTVIKFKLMDRCHS